MKTRRYRVPVYPISAGNGTYHRVQRLTRAGGAQVWETVAYAKPAVAERILAHRRTDGEKVRLVQR